MALQQPNYPALAEHLAGVANEVRFMHNAPIANMANVPNLLNQMQQQLAWQVVVALYLVGFVVFGQVTELRSS